jgi:hypothetical protein
VLFFVRYHKVFIVNLKKQNRKEERKKEKTLLSYPSFSFFFNEEKLSLSLSRWCVCSFIYFSQGRKRKGGTRKRGRGLIVPSLSPT